MTFKFFKISLVSVAKLPHTDTYYACFEHNTIENDACIVNFNDKIDTSKVKAFTQLINFYSFGEFENSIKSSFFILHCLPTLKPLIVPLCNIFKSVFLLINRYSIASANVSNAGSCWLSKNMILISFIIMFGLNWF